MHGGDDRGLARAIGQDQQESGDQPKAGNHPGKGQIRQIHRAVSQCQGRTGGHEIAQHRPHQQNQRTFGPTQLAQDDGGRRRCDGRGQRRQMPPFQGLRTRAQHDQHAQKADHHGGPAMRPHPFPQDRDRQDRHQQGGGEQDRINLCQRQMREGQETAHSRDHAHGGAQRHPAGIGRAQRAGGGVAHDDQRDQRKG